MFVRPRPTSQLASLPFDRMPRLNISTYCARRVTRGDGAHLRHAIENAWSADEPVVLDFAGVTIASVSFLDEALGLLAREHSLQELTKRVKVENMVPADRALLNAIVTSRARERGLGRAESERSGPASGSETPRP